MSGYSLLYNFRIFINNSRDTISGYYLLILVAKCEAIHYNSGGTISGY
jgi:hypothetical protein